MSPGCSLPERRERRAHYAGRTGWEHFLGQGPYAVMGGR
jgi:hypothetical protein